VDRQAGSDVDLACVLASDRRQKIKKKVQVGPIPTHPYAPLFFRLPQ